MTVFGGALVVFVVFVIVADDDCVVIDVGCDFGACTIVTDDTVGVGLVTGVTIGVVITVVGVIVIEFCTTGTTNGV